MNNVVRVIGWRLFFMGELELMRDYAYSVVSVKMSGAQLLGLGLRWNEYGTRLGRG